MKIRKIANFLILVLLVITVFMVSTKVNAVTTFKEVETLRSYETNKSSYASIKGITNFNGEDYSQLIHIFSQKLSKTSKVVTWAVKKDSGALSRETLAAICADYEKLHPDYEVIGGINADQFTLGFGSSILDAGKDYYNTQPYYPMIADNEGWFVMTSLPVRGGGNICFINNSDNVIDAPLVRRSLNLNHGNLKIAQLSLYILDEEGNKIKKYRLTGVNETPKDNESSVFACYNTSENIYKDVKIKSEYPVDNIFIVNDAERCYPSNSISYTQKETDAQDAFFGKGYITEISDTATLSYGDFAIVSKDINLINDLKINSHIIVQFDLPEEYLDVESAIGFHTVQRENGVNKVLSSGDSYNNRKYPRSIIGYKENGEIFLMAIDGLQASIGATGAHFDEINAILEYYGVVTAYQMDGGGSVTACIRNNKGGFDTVNHPSDGSSRRVLNAVLLVEEKKPHVTLEIVSQELDNLVLKINKTEACHELNSAILTIDGKDYDITNTDTINITLGRNNSYEYQVKAVYVDEEYTEKNTLYVPFQLPTLDIIKDGNNLLIEITDIDNTLKDYYLLIDQKKYNFVEKKVIIDYNYSDVYLRYIYNDGKKQYEQFVYHPESIGLRETQEIYEETFFKVKELELFN